MSAYAAIQAVNALCALTIAVFILFVNKSRKPIPFSYALFSLLLFYWSITNVIWAVQTTPESAAFWQRLHKDPACFIHIAFFNFILVLTDKIKRHQKLLITGYLAGVVLLILNLNKVFIDYSYVRYLPPYGYWAHGTPLLFTLITVETTFILISFFVLASSIVEAKQPFKMRLQYFFVVSLIGWIGGMTSWFYFFDAAPIPPIGHGAVVFYQLASVYLIFKHDILKLNLALKRTFIYASLTLFITLIFTVFIIVFERLFQSYFGYKSLLISILAAGTITMFFNPVKDLLTKFIDEYFFGKNISALSAENARLRQELQQQDRMKAVATLAAGMAHEIKNPLTSIKTFTEYLPQRYNDGEFRAKFQKIVSDEIERVNNIVKQVLDFAKPKPPELTMTAIQPIIDETIDLLSNKFVQHNIQIEKDLRDDLSLLIDRNQIKQVFLNLFLNSINAMPNGGMLKTSSALGSGQALITVQDTGCGIPSDQINHVFDPFFTTNDDHGTGLGLAIVYGIVQEHGGRITVESERGKGTAFTLAFPLNPSTKNGAS